MTKKAKKDLTKEQCELLRKTGLIIVSAAEVIMNSGDHAALLELLCYRAQYPGSNFIRSSKYARVAYRGRAMADLSSEEAIEAAVSVGLRVRLPSD